MKIVAIVGKKGGSGKTPIAEALSVESALQGERVALIDLDPQGTATKWSYRRAAHDQDDPNPIVESAQTVDLARVLERHRRNGVKLVFLDTPPKDSEITVEAARAAHVVLVPCSPVINDVETLPDVARLLELARNRPPAAVVVCQADPQGERRPQEALQVARDHGFIACPVVLRERREWWDAPRTGQAVTEYAPGSKSADELRELLKFTRKLMNKQTSKQEARA